jgi:hypothetical protein
MTEATRIDYRLKVMTCRKNNMKVLDKWLSNLDSINGACVELQFVYPCQPLPKKRKRSFEPSINDVIIPSTVQKTRSYVEGGKFANENRILREENDELKAELQECYREIKKLKRTITDFDSEPVGVEEGHPLDDLFDPVSEQGCIIRYSPELICLALKWLTDCCISAQAVQTIFQSFKDRGLWSNNVIPSVSYFRKLRDCLPILNLQMSRSFVENSMELSLWMDETPSGKGFKIYALGFMNQDCVSKAIGTFRFEEKADCLQLKSEKVKGVV